MAATSRHLLLQAIADLLGFEDGASDVLDHLLTIESTEDLVDYLSQLLGSGKQEAVERLAQNIARFQKGETVTTEEDNDNTSDSKPKAEPNYAVAAASKKKKGKGHKTTPPRQRQNAKTPPRPKQTFSGKVTSGTTGPRPAKTNNPTPSETIQKQQQPKAALKEPPHSAEAESEKPIPKSRPTRGTPKFICGCFGNFHKPLTNCLFCGRVSCEKEGYDYCPFCGYLVERSHGSTAAEKHKERLLRFDREYAKRTIVLDDQADHFFMNQQSLNWMTSQKERDQAVAQEQERRTARQQHPKMTLNLNL